MQIQHIIIIALAAAFIAAAATCAHTKRTGELRAEEARQDAERWESTARANAEALERTAEWQRRAADSTRDFFDEVDKAEARHGEAERDFEELREDSGACVWLDERVPDSVRDIIGKLYARPDCD